MRFFVLTIATAGLFLFVSTFRINAAPGDLDSTFGNGGKVISPFTQYSDRTTSIQVQPDGKIIVSGYSYDNDPWCPCDYSTSGFIARYNSSGTLDASFGSNGKIVTPSYLEHVGVKTVLQPDGKIVAIGRRLTLNNAGNQIIADDFAVFRYNANGTPDASFGTGGKVFTSVEAGRFEAYYADSRDVVLQPDGKIVVMGFIFVNGSGYKFGIVRYDPDGSLDNNFGTSGKVITAMASNFGPDCDVNSMLLQPDGKIVLVGRYHYDIILVRYNPDGSLDSGFGTNGKFVHATTDRDGGWDSVLQPDGKIVVGSEFYDKIVRYNADGSVDTSFDVNGIVRTESGYWWGTSIALQPDGKIVGFGSGMLSPGANPTWGFAALRLNPNGSADTSFGTNGRLLTPVGTNGQSFGLAVALQADGNILGAGVTDVSAALGDAGIVRYGSSSSVSVSGRVTTPDGRDLRNATVTITDSLGVRRTAMTSSLGFYSFDNVRTGEIYTIAVQSRRYRFASQNPLVDDDLMNVDFVGLE